MRIPKNHTNTTTTGHCLLLLPPRQLPHLRQGRRSEKDNKRSLNTATLIRKHDRRQQSPAITAEFTSDYDDDDNDNEPKVPTHTIFSPTISGWKMKTKHLFANHQPIHPLPPSAASKTALMTEYTGLGWTGKRRPHNKPTTKQKKHQSPLPHGKNKHRTRWIHDTLNACISF